MGFLIYFIMEIWKPVPNYENRYEVSNLGRVKSLNYNKTKKIKYLIPIKMSTNYVKVGLFKHGKMKQVSIHILVAMAFLNHSPDGHTLVVNHKDWDKTNNNLDNLEVVTCRQNSAHRKNPKTSKYIGVSYDKKLKKYRSEIRIKKKLKYLGTYDTEIDASNAYQKELKKLNEIAY